MAVFFHSEDIRFVFSQKLKHKQWIKRVIQRHKHTPGNLNFIFTSKDYLLKINQEYLNHTHHTDVITFDYSTEGVISGDIFIGIEQVRRNSELLKVSFQEELRRVIIHGVLHLIDFDDKDEAGRKIMREKEEEALTLWIED